MIKMSTLLSKTMVIVIVILFICIAAAPVISAINKEAKINYYLKGISKKGTLDDISSKSLFFTENLGQFHEDVLFQTKTPKVTIYLCKDKLITVFTKAQEEKLIHTKTHNEININQKQLVKTFQIDVVSIIAEFVNANPNVAVKGVNRLPHNNNYFIGNDPEKWYTDIPNYQSIIYQDIYPSIDLIYYNIGDMLKYDFIVHPGANPSQIGIRYQGTNHIQITPEGDLKIKTRLGSIYEKQPVIYQEIDGKQHLMDASYLLNNNILKFNIKGTYNQDYPLIIDPGLLYSTYLGGSFYNVGQSIAVDNKGCAYLAGWTASTDFPMQNPYDGTYNGGYCDIFVTKFSPGGNTLVYSTYIGGSGEGADNARRITIDNNGCVYLTGYSFSNDFPMQNPYDNSLDGECDVIVTKLSAYGNELEYSTYIGGTGISNEYGGCIAVDSNYCAYITGWTYSDDFPVENPYDSTFNAFPGASDVFVTKFSPQGDKLVYSTYLGGSISQDCEAIAVDVNGCAYVSGLTYSDDFPLQNPYDDTYNIYENQEEAFVTKFSPQGNTLEYSTYLGGNGEDWTWSIAVDDNDCAYVTGQTGSSDFPMVNAYDDTYNGGNCDLYVTKFSPQGNTLEYSTYLGGSERDFGCFIAVDNNDCAYITGATDSSDFPMINSFDDTHNGLYDSFVTKLSSLGNTLKYSTYLGGSSGDWANGIFVDNNRCAYVVGHTRSSDFPVKKPFDNTLDSDRDVFLTKFPKSGGKSFGDIRDLSEFEDNIPRTRATSYLWFEWIFERFPLLERLLGLIKKNF